MEHNDDEIISKKLRIMLTVKKLKEKIALYGHKTTERNLKFFEKAIKFYEELVNDEDEYDIVYLSDRINYFDGLFSNYVIKNNTDQVSEKSTTNNSTFIKTPEWIKNKKFTNNPQNGDNKCFQYSVTVALNYQNIKQNPERISKIKPVLNNLNWDNIKFPPQEQDYKTFEMNNKSIALNILFANDQKISHYYKSGFKKTGENQVILLMINDNQCNSPEKQYYLAVKRLNALLKKKSDHSGDYCLNCFKLFRNKSKFKTHKF